MQTLNRGQNRGQKNKLAESLKLVHNEAMKKPYFVMLFVLVMLVISAFALFNQEPDNSCCKSEQATVASTSATCTPLGRGECNACTSCRYCNNCAKMKGKCTVCIYE